MNIHRNWPKINQLHQVTMKPVSPTKKGSQSIDTPKQTSNNDSVSSSTAPPQSIGTQETSNNDSISSSKAPLTCEEAEKSQSQSNSGAHSAVATADTSLADVATKPTSTSHATHRCPHCSKSYVYRTGLSKHLKKHTDKPAPAGHI